MKHLTHKGFTIVEMIIVTVVVVLLIGAVIKGQAMIDDARQIRLINDLQGISAAYFTYLDKYSAAPGDDPGGNRWTAVADGDGDGRISGSETAPGGESLEAWQALRSAGLLSGDPTETGAEVLPRHPYGSNYGIGDFKFQSGIGVRNRVLINGLPAKVAHIIDSKFDDGIYNTGNIQSSAAYTAGTIVDLSYAL